MSANGKDPNRGKQERCCWFACDYHQRSAFRESSIEPQDCHYTGCVAGEPEEGARAQGAGSTGTRRVPRSSSESRRAAVNRDGLLQSLFPTGIPAREDAIRQVNAWLDEAERLARMR